MSTEYSNLKTELELQCPEGHSNFVTYEKFRRGTYECPICKQNKFYRMNDSVPKKNGFRVLAFDQATITSGWSVFDDQTLVKYGSHTSDGSRSTMRIANTKAWVASMIGNWHPDLVVFEDIQLQTYKKNEDERADAVVTYKKLAHLQGVLKNFCYEMNIPYKIAPPGTWRSHSKVKGNTRSDQKRSAQLIVKKLYDISVTQDESDAILIGRWAADDNKVNEIIEFV